MDHGLGGVVDLSLRCACKYIREAVVIFQLSCTHKWPRLAFGAFDYVSCSDGNSQEALQAPIAAWNLEKRVLLRAV